MNELMILGRVEINQFIDGNPDWKEVEGKLVADFVLKDFEATMRVVNKIAEHAEMMNHHPEWRNVYNKLSIILCTHDADDKITDLDTNLAKTISNIVADGGG